MSEDNYYNKYLSVSKMYAKECENSKKLEFIIANQRKELEHLNNRDISVFKKTVIALIDFLNKHETPFLLTLAIFSAVNAAFLMLAVYLGFVR